jgi:hypothetical protein
MPSLKTYIRLYFRHKIGNRDALSKKLNTQELFFRKVAYSKCDVTSEMLYTKFCHKTKGREDAVW